MKLKEALLNGVRLLALVLSEADVPFLFYPGLRAPHPRLSPDYRSWPLSYAPLALKVCCQDGGAYHLGSWMYNYLAGR